MNYSVLSSIYSCFFILKKSRIILNVHSFLSLNSRRSILLERKRRRSCSMCGFYIYREVINQPFKPFTWITWKWRFLICDKKKLSIFLMTFSTHLSDAINPLSSPFCQISLILLSRIFRKCLKLIKCKSLIYRRMESNGLVIIDSIDLLISLNSTNIFSSASSTKTSLHIKLIALAFPLRAC